MFVSQLNESATPRIVTRLRYMYNLARSSNPIKLLHNYTYLHVMSEFQELIAKGIKEIPTPRIANSD
jgi:hypothetical protein